jgi:hypothetical protein
MIDPFHRRECITTRGSAWKARIEEKPIDKERAT